MAYYSCCYSGRICDLCDLWPIETFSSNDVQCDHNFKRSAIIYESVKVSNNSSHLRYNVSENFIILLLYFRRSNICHSLNSTENCKNINSKKSSVWKWCFTPMLTKVNKSIKTTIKVKKNSNINFHCNNNNKKWQNSCTYIYYIFPRIVFIICEHKQNYFRLISMYVFSLSLFPVSLYFN